MDEPPLSPSVLKGLSLRVFDLLDNIGASEELRRHCMLNAVNEEVIGTLVARLQGANFSCYIFGSSSEGSTTLGLKSDVDYLISQDKLEVFQQENDITASDESPDCLLLVTDPWTYPGYAKLQLALNGVLQHDLLPDIGLPPNELQLDLENRVVITKRFYYASMGDEEHGPAFSVPSAHGYAAKDMVQAFRCRTWPKEARKWFERISDKHWPTKAMVNEMKQYGFFLVPVGHKASSEMDLEWRISLSQQERVLMMNLNSTQYKCYILMKMIKNDILPTMVDEESITSYHCKTCLFYTVEETPDSFWNPDNILPCLQKCLSCILEWVNCKNCPNYFIPEENMFDGRIGPETLVRLKTALKELINSNFAYLLHIKSDMFGDLLCEDYSAKCCTESNEDIGENTNSRDEDKRTSITRNECLDDIAKEGHNFENLTTDTVMSTKKRECTAKESKAVENSTNSFLGMANSTKDKNTNNDACDDSDTTDNSSNSTVSVENLDYLAAKLSAFMRPYSQLIVARNAIFDLCISSPPERVADTFLNILGGLNMVRIVAEHSEEETKQALSLLTPYIELSMMSALIADRASGTTSKEILWKFVANNRWNELRLSSDLLTAKLKQSTLMYMLGFEDVSFEILDYLLELISYPSYQVSTCYCRKFIPQRKTPKHALEAVDGKDFKIFYYHNVAPCVVFLPSEQPLVPIALAYEMIRSVGMPQETRHPMKDAWFDWAIVDAKFLLYFLLYLHLKDLNFGLEQVYIIFMEHLLVEDSLLGHKETALNILGWVYKNEGQLERAYQCFRQSLSLQKLHNAAIWHICVTVNSQINTEVAL